MIPMRLTSILTRAMKSTICQSVVPQLWRWIEEHWNTTTDPTVKVKIHPIQLLPQDRRLQQLWEIETLHLRPQNELAKAASGTRHGTLVLKSTCILSNSPMCEVTTSTSGHVSPRETLESSCQLECPWRLPPSFSSVGKQVQHSYRSCRRRPDTRKFEQYRETYRSTQAHPVTHHLKEQNCGLDVKDVARWA